MSGRKRISKTLPLMDVPEKLLTKKEAEANTRLHMTCPALQKKHYSPIRAHKLVVSNHKARILSFTKSMNLSGCYDPSLKKTYFAQMYKIQDTLGEGSFGIVYKVICKENNESYAVKISKKCFLNKASYDEIKLLERIGDHPNIVKYYFAWEEMSRIFMQLELCALSLDTYAKSNHAITEQQLWDILIDMVRALNHLHDRGLIHLDIKPENIMMTTDGFYKLGDFGLLFDVKSEDVKVRKKYDIMEGDAKYLAKEVLEGKATTAADIFSLGITMLELATDLVLPINGPLWQRLRVGTYDDPCFTNVPHKLKSLVCKMMAPKPNLRPKAKQILCSTFVQELLTVQCETPRINYYDTWRQTNIENMDCQPVAVCINRSPSVEQTPEHNMNIANSLSGNMEDGTPCVTPPRKFEDVKVRKKYDIMEGDAKYLAKEVLQGKATTAADIFSLGITMLELATDLVLPINGPLWQHLRVGTYDDPCFTNVLHKLKSLVCKMMAPKPNLRPKAKQILCSTFVQELLTVQCETPRINYYDTWRQTNIENMDCQPVAVCINRSPSVEQTPEHNMNIANSLSGNMEDGTPCVTPPRKVSRVIIYNM